MDMMLDLTAFTACFIVWLGPLIYNSLRGRFSLLHPIGFIPILMVYMLVPPLIYRWQGETLLLTSTTWASDPWFLATPMLILALAGIFYHLGVRLARTSLVLTEYDDVTAYASLKTVQGVSGFTLFVIAGLFLGVTFTGRLFMPLSDYSRGYYWILLLFLSNMCLPLVVFQQNRKLGTLFFLLIIPSALIVRSKAAFLYFVIVFVVFYHKKILQLSKTVSIFLLVLVLLTPTAVALYDQKEGLSTSFSLSNLDDVSWSDAIGIISHREYAFESFACVYQERQEGEPFQWGAETLKQLSQAIPVFLWPGKPLGFYDFPQKYLPLDPMEYEWFYAPFGLTPFYLDFDLPGALLATLFLGFIIGFGYRVGLTATLRRREAWPLILYLCVVINGKWFVEASVASPITNSLCFSFSVLLVVWLSSIFPKKSESSRYVVSVQPSAGQGRG
jgi:hypothetical protein